MSEPLWDVQSLLAASGGTADGQAPGAITGVSIDSRDLHLGDLFVALTDQRDGHDFVPTAFIAGAGAALVREDYQRAPEDGFLIRVDDPLQGLERIAVAARARLGGDARVFAVTGSAGKTTTKEMLRACFEATAPGRVHASEKSYNNHWGVPLTLARMPADTAFAVIEIGMNHAGEIRPLTRFARPHVAVVTTIAPAHLGNFRSIEEIAEAKAEIFEGLEPEGRAVIPFDAPHCDLLQRKAETVVPDPGYVWSFGEGGEATMRLRDIVLTPKCSHASLQGPAGILDFEVGVPGRHNVGNAAAAITTWFCAIAGMNLPSHPDDLGYPGFERVREVLANLRMDPVGRGQVQELSEGMTLIDESYNANPASMRAALGTLALYPGDRRRIAVLGDMLELGERSVELHAGLKEAIDEAGVDLVFACGPDMLALYHELAPKQRGLWAETAVGITQTVLELLQPGDVVMVKGSLGSQMAPIVAEIISRHRGDGVAG